MGDKIIQNEKRNTYTPPKREYKKRETIKKIIVRLKEELKKLPQSQLNMILGFNKSGETIIDRKLFNDANLVTTTLSNQFGTVKIIVEKNKQLRKINDNLLKYTDDLETILRDNEIFDFTTKVEPGVLYENQPHKTFLTDQFSCPKCSDPGFPLEWKGKWLWCHFEEPLEYTSQKQIPKIENICSIERGELGNWWEDFTHQPQFGGCFFYFGRSEKILNTILIRERASNILKNTTEKL